MTSTNSKKYDDISDLFISGVFTNDETITEQFFDSLNLGEIYDLRIINGTKTVGGSVNNNAHVRLRWNKSRIATTTREQLLRGKTIKITYDDPWFWYVSIFRNT
jgi:hypothetical protein